MRTTQYCGGDYDDPRHAEVCLACQCAHWFEEHDHWEELIFAIFVIALVVVFCLWAA